MTNRRYSGAGGLRWHTALTLVETVVSAALVGIMLVAALNTVSAARLGQRALDERRQGYELAAALLAEILAQPYADETQLESLRTQILLDGQKVTQTLGPESGEAGVNRSKFDDVDDYHGWSESPPQHQDGTVLTALSGWKRCVTVEFVSGGDAHTTTTQDEGAKRITVSVVHNNVPSATLVGLRTLGPPPTQACCLPDGTALDMRPTDCAALGGTAHGVGTTTLNTSCDAPIRALAHWKFDEGAGTVAADCASGFNATIVGATWTTGHFGRALNFTHDEVIVPYADALSLTAAVTISAWIEPTAISGNFATILQKGCAPTPVNYYLAIVGGEVEFGFHNDVWYEFRTAGVGLKKDTWYHVATTYNMMTGGILTYVNSVQVYAATATTTPWTDTSDIDIGNSCKNEAFPGVLDDLQIYSVVLTADQIKNVMQGKDP
jgi:type II secretory pathway pseudopilin PulG